MGTTLTIRTNEALREALARRAASQGTSVSELIRTILEDAIAERPLATKIRHVKGRLRLPPTSSDPWRKHLKKRNWRS